MSPAQGDPVGGPYREGRLDGTPQGPNGRVDTLSETPSLSKLLELHPKMRGNPGARALADRCTALAARAQEADPAALEAPYHAAAAFRDALLWRFGAPSSASLQ